MATPIGEGTIIFKFSDGPRVKKIKDRMHQRTNTEVDIQKVFASKRPPTPHPVEKGCDSSRANRRKYVLTVNTGKK